MKLTECKKQTNNQLTGPTMSETWDTVVPDAAPRYSTRVPGA